MYIPFLRFPNVMARIFNIYFTHEELMHNAVVSVRTTPFYIEYTLNNFNEQLLQFLPSNKIISREPGHFIFQNAGPESSSSLMNAIIKAVSEHLHATEA
ncbi:MAG TPA: hypothetical protein VNR87_09270 [Flavisolibacter sp.]|nr:hypothetical protein [Flavisolibacter sp.]